MIACEKSAVVKDRLGRYALDNTVQYPVPETRHRRKLNRSHLYTMVRFSVSCRLQICSTCVRFILWVWGIGLLDTQKGTGKGTARLLPPAVVEPSPGFRILTRGTLVPSRRTAWKHLIFRDERNRKADLD